MWLRAVHSGCLDLIPPRELVQLFLLLLVFMHQAKICCHLFFTPSSVFQTELLSLWMLADVAVVMELRKRSSRACLLKRVRGGMEEEVSASELTVHASPFCIPWSFCYCVLSPHGRIGAGYRLAAVAMISHWMHGGKTEYVWHRPVEIWWLYTEKTSLILIGNNQFYSHWAPKSVSRNICTSCGATEQEGGIWLGQLTRRTDVLNPFRGRKQMHTAHPEQEEKRVESLMEKNAGWHGQQRYNGRVIFPRELEWISARRGLCGC